MAVRLSSRVSHTLTALLATGLLALCVALSASLPGSSDGQMSTVEQAQAETTTGQATTSTSTQDSTTTTDPTRTATQDTAKRTVRVAVSSYPNSFLYQDKQGSISGYAYGYLTCVAKLENWDLVYVPVEFPDSLTAVQDGTVDLIPGLLYTDERGLALDYTEHPVAKSSTVLFTTAASPLLYDDFDSYQGMKVGYIKGHESFSIISDYLTQNGVACTYIGFDTQQDMENALLDGNLDACICSLFRIQSGYKIISRNDPDEVYFATSPNSPEIGAELDEAYDAIQREDPYLANRLDETYLSPLLSNVAFTPAEQEFIDNSGTITVYVASDTAPVSYLNEATGNYLGIVEDLYTNISSNTGLRFSFASMDEVVDEYGNLTLPSGANSFLVGAVANESTMSGKLVLSNSNTLYSDSVSMVFPDDVALNNLSDLSVAIPSGLLYYQYIATAYGFTDIRYYDSWEECAQAVADKKVDCTLVSSYCMSYLFAHASYTGLSYSALPDSTTDYSAGVSQDSDPLLMSVLNKGINRISEDDERKAMVSNLSTATPMRTWRDILQEDGLALSICITVLLIILIPIVLRTTSMRRRAAEATALALTRSEQANKAKSDFLSRMSHDLRTPLNAIMGLSSFALEDSTSERQRSYLRDIDAAGQYLLGFVNDILDMARMENNRMTLDPEPYPFNAFINETVAIAEPLAREKNIRLEVRRVNLTTKVLLFDRQRLAQVYLNLLSNAIKYTQLGGNVRFSVQTIERPSKGKVDVHVEVRDDGIGMDPDFMKHMYEPFDRVNDTPSTEQGVGLGLAIVHNLVGLMGGSVDATSQVGHGSTFTVKLSLDETPLAPTDAKPDADANADLTGTIILLCEDQPLNTEVVSTLLESKGATVEKALNGSDGVNLYLGQPSGHYSAVLMDLHMPVMDGFQATRFIRNSGHEDAKTIPIVALTADAFDENRQKAREAGVDAHLMKPIDARELFNTLGQLIHTGTQGH